MKCVAGPVGCWQVDDVKQTISELVATCAEELHAIADWVDRPVASTKYTYRDTPSD
jgi:hypothetical protein